MLSCSLMIIFRDYKCEKYRVSEWALHICLQNVIFSGYLQLVFSRSLRASPDHLRGCFFAELSLRVMVFETGREGHWEGYPSTAEASYFSSNVWSKPSRLSKGGFNRDPPIRSTWKDANSFKSTEHSTLYFCILQRFVLRHWKRSWRWLLCSVSSCRLVFADSLS